MSYKNNSSMVSETTNLGNFDDIKKTDSEEFRLLITRLQEKLDGISIALNKKDSGTYSTEEFITGQELYPRNEGEPYRPIIRKVIQTGQLPNNGLKTIAHGIDTTTMINPTTPEAKLSFYVTRIYGVAYNNDYTLDQNHNYVSGQDNRKFIPIPETNGNDSVRVTIDKDNINITTFRDMRAYNLSHVVIEYTAS